MNATVFLLAIVVLTTLCEGRKHQREWAKVSKVTQGHDRVKQDEVDEDGRLLQRLEVGSIQRSSSKHRKLRVGGQNFVATRNIEGGHTTEIRVHQNGVVGMETVMRRAGETGLFVREATDGKRLVQMIFNDRDHLSDCDLVKNSEAVDKFLGRFIDRPTAQISDLRAQQRSREIDIAQLIRTDHHHHFGEGTNSSLAFLEESVVDAPLNRIVELDVMKRECIALHKDLRKARRRADGGEKDQTVVKHGHRAKRSMLIYPGTKWCGSGFTAAQYEDLGESVDTDKCCRHHDHCPHMIEGFETKFNMFNFRFTTISHCSCDESFLVCLKSARTDVANMVGRLYFNMVGTRCFVFNKDKVCMERSWWGTCKRYEEQVTAEVADPLIY